MRKNSLVSALLIALLIFVSLAACSNKDSKPTKTVSAATKELQQYINSDPAKVDNSTLPITPTDELFTTGTPPKIDMTKYSLKVEGRVETPLNLTYEELLKYPSVTEVVLLICPWVGAGNVEWTGVPLTTILQEAGVKPEATEVTFYAIDGYQNTQPIEEVMRDGVFLAYIMNGEVLSKEHGYPLRLVVRGELGGRWVKWIDRIEVGQNEG